jgi:hypothetical protein
MTVPGDGHEHVGDHEQADSVECFHNFVRQGGKDSYFSDSSLLISSIAALRSLFFASVISG